MSVGRLERFVPALCWLAGLVAAFHPTLRSGFATVQGYPGNDPRLVAFILEHSYRWLAGFPLHADFWSPPIFFPQQGVGAYTEILVGTAPPYWLARAAGAAPLTAYQLWMLACWSLNYVAGYALLRRVFAVGAAPAAAGALLFAFGNARMATMMHQQLVPYFYPVLAILALERVLRDDGATGARAAAWLAVFAAALVAQFYTAFYTLYFCILGLAAGLLWTLLLPSLRRPFLAALGRNALAVAACGLGAALLAAPLAWRYLGAAGDVGFRAYDVERLPRPSSWLLMGPGNLLYGWVDHLKGFASWSRPMHHNGVGLLTLLLAAIGLARARRKPAVVLFVLATATVFVATVRLPGDFSLFGLTRTLVPGGGAIRAVARVGALLLFPVSAGLALFLEQQSASGSRGARSLVVALALLCFVEQLNISYGFEKPVIEARIARLARHVDPGCAAFFLVRRGAAYDYDLQDDAMWVALATGIPTVNGRSGATPPGWNLNRVQIADDADRSRIETALAAWLAQSGVARDRVCMIELEPDRPAAPGASIQRGDDEQR